MRNRLQANRAKIEEALISRRDRRFFSPAFLAQHLTLVPLLQQYARGQLIDLGCGDSPFREFLPPNVTRYDTLDIAPRAAPLSFVGDIQKMPMVEPAAYDTVLCLETLEHVPNPLQAACEMHRILAPRGMVILSVPHLSRLHDEPNDFYRFTHFGLRHIFTSAGFTIVEIRAKGGVFSFLGHQVSSVFLSALWSPGAVWRVAWWLNKWFITYPCHALDRWLGTSSVLALGYVLVAQKSNPSTLQERDQ